MWVFIHQRSHWTDPNLHPKYKKIPATINATNIIPKTKVDKTKIPPIPIKSPIF
jgi:hypothetical protein